jgi:hypothetical protein
MTPNDRSTRGAKARPSRRAGFRLFALLVLLGFTGTAQAQPPFFQPQTGFYEARGTKLKVEWRVEPTVIPEDGQLTATLVIGTHPGGKLLNPHEIVRPDLSKLPAFTDRFRSIENVPRPPVPPDATEVTFAYRLRPRDRSVSAVPRLDFYFDTGIKGKTQYQNAAAASKPITVTEPPPRPKPPPVPMGEPDSLFEVTTGPAALGREPFRPRLWAWVGTLVLGPVAAIGWYAVWRRVYPDGARLARLRRTRAARRAVDTTRKAGRSADPAGAIAGAVRGYLRARFPFSAAAETPSEIEHELRLAGLGEAESGEAAGFFRRADAARFAPPADTPVSLADEAKALIARLEAVE